MSWPGAGACTRAAPNHALEPTPNSLRSFLAVAAGRGSPLALGSACAQAQSKREWLKINSVSNNTYVCTSLVQKEESHP